MVSPFLNHEMLLGDFSDLNLIVAEPFTDNISMVN